MVVCALPRGTFVPCVPLGQSEGKSDMIDDVGRPPETASGNAARRLMTETGINEAQARELVAFLGPHNWPSLLREARVLKKP